MNLLRYRPAVVPLRRAGSPRRSVPRVVEPLRCLRRALVMPVPSVVVRVLSKRDPALYIKDGVHGRLSDAGPRLIRSEAPGATACLAFFGPTCDSLDRMPGPFFLPDHIQEGDGIEIGPLGAYGGALRTAFNGFDQASLVEVRDRPLWKTTGSPPEAMVQAA